MARTPLLRLFKGLHLVRRAEREGVTDASLRLNRRQFVVGATALGLVPLATACPADGEGPVPDGDKKVGVIGGGVAGLHCAALLKTAGVSVKVFEASPRVGGRIFTDRQTFAAQDGQHCELGGELVDSDHETMFALAEAFGLEMLDYNDDDDALDTIVAHFGGEKLALADLVASYAAIADRVDVDVTAADSDDDAFAELDSLSITAWLDTLETDGVLTAGDPIRQLLEVAYTIEYGLEASAQSALNLIYLAGTDPTALELFGASDERFHFKDGNDGVIAGLAGIMGADVETGAKLVKIADSGEGVEVSVDRDGDVSAEVFDRVVLALPFTMLREVDLTGLSLSADKLATINGLGYGTNAKLMLGFSERIWRTTHDSNGESFSDLGYQSTWETSRLQPGDAGIITHYTGGDAGVAAGLGTPEERAAEFLGRFEPVFPGVSAAHNDVVARFHWPTHPFTKASYTCYRVGEWNQFFGTEGLPEGAVHFCGEHTSADYQGYMEGGALTGAIAADEVAEALGVELLPLTPEALTAQTPWVRIIARARRARAQRDQQASRRRRRVNAAP